MLKTELQKSPLIPITAMTTQYGRKSFLALALAASIALSLTTSVEASSRFPMATSQTGSTIEETEEGSPASEAEDKEKSKADIEKLLKDIETQWNSHNLDAVMEYYDDKYINNDGLDKKAVKELTRDFWKTYPDAKSVSETRNIRIEGKFATVESRDRAEGSTAHEPSGIGSRGILTSLSEGQLYLKRVGKKWSIIGDRIDYERVQVAFGLARDLDTSFIAPQQVRSGQEYSAKLEVQLPPDLIAVGSITNEPLKYPQPAHKDVWRQIENQVLERIIHANKNNYNELLMATIGITDSSRKNLKGLTYLTRRLNVVPESNQLPDADAKKVLDQTAKSILDDVQDIDDALEPLDDDSSESSPVPEPKKPDSSSEETEKKELDEKGEDSSKTIKKEESDSKSDLDDSFEKKDDSSSDQESDEEDE